MEEQLTDKGKDKQRREDANAGYERGRESERERQSDTNRWRERERAEWMDTWIAR